MKTARLRNEKERYHTDNYLKRNNQREGTSMEVKHMGRYFVNGNLNRKQGPTPL